MNSLIVQFERGETMTKLNLTQAAQAAGIARGTLYRHIKDGKVTCEENDNGERVIDTSEQIGRASCRERV